jgi:cell division protein FtsB
MGWFKKKADPLNERARALSAEIAALEAQIKKLDGKPEATSSSPPNPNAPRLRSTAMPHGAATTTHHPQPPAAPEQREPIFEDVDQARLQAKLEAETTQEHYNDLGVRKYDLAAFFRRLKNHFRGPSTANPKLVNYLAAGSIQGLRPMRYEKRVARNRFLFVVIGLLAVLVGIFAVMRGHH